MPDIINFEILRDGTVKFKTSDISQVNHKSADELMAAIDEDLGKCIKTEKIPHEFWKNRIVQKGGKIVVNG